MILFLLVNIVINKVISSYIIYQYIKQLLNKVILIYKYINKIKVIISNFLNQQLYLYNNSINLIKIKILISIIKY